MIEFGYGIRVTWNNSSLRNLCSNEAGLDIRLSVKFKIVRMATYIAVRLSFHNQTIIEFGYDFELFSHLE